LLVANPFVPPAGSWLVVPLVSERRLVGVMIASASPPLSLDPTAATLVTLLGDLLASGIATARLRQQLQGAEIERERARLAAEIHDGLAQDLALEDLSVHIPLGGIEDAVKEVSARRGQGLPLVVSCDGPAVDVSPEITAVVVRVLTEALANSARHAQPQHVEVRMCVEDGRLTLEIEDDGVGFQPAEAGGPGDGHFGLTLMRERARSAGGLLTVSSAPDDGARVRLEVPV
jgi:signal transduction histidine kinase